MTSLKINPNVAIIILNWNGWKDTIECLESLYQINYSNHDVVLVDNNSKDDSILKIKEYLEGKLHPKSDYFEYDVKNKPIDIIEYIYDGIEIIKEDNENFQNSHSNNKLILIKNDRNYGFAEGNNIGIQHALKFLNSDYVLLLNNDTVVDKQFLDILIKAESSSDNTGVFGPTIYWYDDKIKIQSAGVKLYSKLGIQKVLGLNEIDIGQFKDISSVDYVSGCALLAKSEIFKEIGFLDRDYFLYWEEVDWCYRAHNAGYDIVHVPDGKIWHKGSVSSTSASKVYYMTRNCFWFMKRNVTQQQYAVFLVFFFTLLFWYRSFILAFYYRDLKRLKCYYKGVKTGFRRYK